ncbi:MAG: hypothetical protein U1E62_18135 [Alsobacter sp.]
MLRVAALALTVALGASPAIAGSVPRIDFAKVCRASSGTPVSRDQLKACLESESQVRDELSRTWSKYSPASRAECAAGLQNAYHPSYVELISCLEMANPGLAKPKALD